MGSTFVFDTSLTYILFYLYTYNTYNNMHSFEVQGGKKLKGEIIPQGAKNEALQIISAVLLTPEKVNVLSEQIFNVFFQNFDISKYKNVHFFKTILLDYFL